MELTVAQNEEKQSGGSCIGCVHQKWVAPTNYMVVPGFSCLYTGGHADKKCVQYTEDENENRSTEKAFLRDKLFENLGSNPQVRKS